jgi:MFS family permease
MASNVRQAGIAQAGLGYAITALGACLVLLAADFGVPPEELAWLPATFGFGLLAMAPAGPLLLRGSPRPALTGGSLAVAAGATLLALAPVPAVAVAGALLLGAGGAAFALVTPAMLAGKAAATQLTKVNAASSSAAVLAPAAIGGLNATGLVSGRLALLLVVPPLVYLAVTARPVAVDSPLERDARPAAGAVARRWAVVVLAVSVEFCFTIWAVARLAAAGMAPGTAAALGTAFPVGMALGRLAGPALIGRIPVVPIGAAITAAGALVVVVAGGPVLITAGLVVAGAGVATLYPVALAALVATPRLSAAHAASLGALASGTAILAAPAALARLADVMDLRLAFLITLPLLAALLLLRHRQ